MGPLGALSLLLIHVELIGWENAQGVLFQEEVKPACGISVTQLTLGPAQVPTPWGQDHAAVCPTCCPVPCGERWPGCVLHTVPAT